MKIISSHKNIAARSQGGAQQQISIAATLSQNINSRFKFYQSITNFALWRASTSLSVDFSFKFWPWKLQNWTHLITVANLMSTKPLKNHKNRENIKSLRLSFNAICDTNLSDSAQNEFSFWRNLIPHFQLATEFRAQINQFYVSVDKVPWNFEFRASENENRLQIADN